MRKFKLTHYPLLGWCIVWGGVFLYSLFDIAFRSDLLFGALCLLTPVGCANWFVPRSPSTRFFAGLGLGFLSGVVCNFLIVPGTDFARFSVELAKVLEMTPSQGSIAAHLFFGASKAIPSAILMGLLALASGLSRSQAAGA